jgi:hypothetical protein
MHIFTYSDDEPRANPPTHPARDSDELVLLYPDDDELRSRTVVSRSRARSTTKYPSWKMARMIQCESISESHVAHLLDADPEIVAFNEQPLTICYSIHGVPHRHYPDLQIVWRSGVKELWEVKPAAKASLPEVIERTRYLQHALPGAGFKYRMVIAEEVTSGPDLENARTLLRHGRTPASVVERERIRKLLVSVPVITWASARRGDIGDRGRCVLARLTLEGFLTFDRSVRITDDTQFMRVDRGRTNL